MVLLIKNKLASFEDVALLSPSSIGISPSGQISKNCKQIPRNAGVPKAKSLPHINLLTEGGSLKAQCSAVLNADLNKLKPKKLIARKVNSAKEDLRQLFENASLRQRVELQRDARHLDSTELICSSTAPNVGVHDNLGSSPLLVSVPLDEQDDDEEDHIYSLTAVAQSWLDFERLFSHRRASSDQAVEQARYDFCQALVQSFTEYSPTVSPLQSPHSSCDLADSPSFRPICSSPGSPAPSATTLANQTITFHLSESPPPEKSVRLSEFSDEELQREFDSFSFHSSQDEEWTSEVESRKQNAMNRTLLDMKRKLAIPVPKLSRYLSDDSLADSAAHRTLVDPQPSSGVSSKENNNRSSYLADDEDEEDEDDTALLPIMHPDSPACTMTPVIDMAVSTCSIDPLLSSQMGDLTLDEEQDDPEPKVTHVEDSAETVWEILSAHLPRFLTSISEESLADEYEIEATSPSPPLSFRRPISPYRKVLTFRRQYTSSLEYMDQVDIVPAVSFAEVIGSFETILTIPKIRISEITDTKSDFTLSPVENPGKTLRRMKKYIDLRNSIVFPAIQSTSSFETLHETTCPSQPQARQLRRVQKCFDLRKAYGGVDISTVAPPSVSTISEYSFQKCFSFESDLEEGHEAQPAFPRQRTLVTKDSTKPPIPPKPPGLLLHRKRVQVFPTTVQGPSSSCAHCDPVPSRPLWSCAKITRSAGKRGRSLSEPIKTLKERLDSIHIDPETIHGHPSSQPLSIPTVNKSRKSKMFENLKRITQKRLQSKTLKI